MDDTKKKEKCPGCEHCAGCDQCQPECEGCQDCCDHEYDPDEGMMCINCDKEYPW